LSDLHRVRLWLVQKTGPDIHRDRAGFAVVDDDGYTDRVRGMRAPSTGGAFGFSVHAHIFVPQGDTHGLWAVGSHPIRDARCERLCRYAARPPLADAQLSKTHDGRILVKLKKRRMSGATHVVLEPVRLLRRLAWLVPPARRHQIRFHGILAPNARDRAKIVPAPRAIANPSEIEDQHNCARSHRPVNAAAIPWAQLLKRIYNVDSLACDRCGGRLRPIAAIVDPDVARRILVHLGLPSERPRFAKARGPP
jgi:phage baseplate assembly protein W